jgi:hypothetical protein
VKGKTQPDDQGKDEAERKIPSEFRPIQGAGVNQNDLQEEATYKTANSGRTYLRQRLHKNNQAGVSLGVAITNPVKKKDGRQSDRSGIDKCDDNRATAFRQSQVAKSKNNYKNQ